MTAFEVHHFPISRRFRGVAGVLGTMAALATPGCFAKQTPTGEGDDGGPLPTTNNAAPKGPLGIHCGTDQATGVGLCLGTTACPQQEINPNAFPNCGLKTTGSPFDVECLCNGTSLCPAGVATTCQDLADLLSRRTVADVCNEVGVGACVDVSHPASTGTTGGTQGTSSSTCDQACAADCASNPTCLVGCGC
jgi:hypothetical protein